MLQTLRKTRLRRLKFDNIRLYVFVVIILSVCFLKIFLFIQAMNFNTTPSILKEIMTCLVSPSLILYMTSTRYILVELDIHLEFYTFYLFSRAAATGPRVARDTPQKIMRGLWPP